MALTYGFYNSYAGDRKYDAMQISEMFDGILADGIIPSQGQLFAVTAGGGMTINVGTGRAWFFHSWTKNDSVMMLTVPASDVSRPRIDAVVLEVNRDQEVRANSIKIVSGEAAVNPVKPTLVTTDKVHQYPLAYITVGAGVEEIKAENIENAVGLTPTPFATGVLETTPLDELWSQWEGEWDTWFANIKLQLSGDIVTNLQGQIDECKKALDLSFEVPDDVLKLWDIKELIGNNKKFKDVLSGLFKPDIITKTEIFTTNGVWIKPDDFISADVFVMGAGGGGQAGAGGDYTYSGRGGYGGHTNRATLDSTHLSDALTVSVTVGTGGTGGTGSIMNGTSGGASSFGTYVSASGGSSGGTNGGTGGSGGGGGGRTEGKLSGNMRPEGGNGATYGGGGAAGVQEGISNGVGGYSGFNGGSGGIYGGGGGGSGGTAGKTTYGAGGSGGSGGQGRGGDGGNANASGGQPGNSGSDGTNTMSLNVPFAGLGKGGSGGSTNTPGYVGGSGGGGGGYGGSGGSGKYGTGPSATISGGSFRYGTSSGAGGGGGYGANGGNGGLSSGPAVVGTYLYMGTVGGGGGGGGYGGPGGNGGNGYSSGTNDYRLYCHGGGGGGGGYGENGHGGNGGSGSSGGKTSRKGGIGAGGGGGCSYRSSGSVSDEVLKDLYNGGDGGSGIVIVTYKYYQWRYNKS